MATIKDVAKLAGVSVSTVSRALSGSVYVNPETKEKIKSAVKTLHYIPDNVARSLKNRRTRTISLLIPTILNPFFPKLVDCFSSEIDRYGYAMMLNVSNYSMEEEKSILSSVKSFSVDGMLYVPGTDDNIHINELLKYDIPTVIVNRNPNVDAACVTNNDYLGGYSSTEFLIKNGHRNICFFTGNTFLQNMRERYHGCQEALEKYGIEKESCIFVSENSSNDIYHKTKELLTYHKNITAIFVASDWMSKAVYSAIQNCGMVIPRDISVIGFDDISDSQYMFPPLTTWRHPIDEISRNAVSILIDSIENGTQINEKKLIVSGQMIIRDSVRSIDNKKQTRKGK